MAYIQLAAYEGWVLLLARLILGIVMLYYGVPKIKDLKANAEHFVHMGFRPGIFWGTIVAVVEFFGGILMVLGLFTGIVAALFGFEMLLGATWKITSTDKKFPDWSYDLLLLTICLVILATGAGFWALG